MQAIGEVTSVEVRPASLDDVFMHYTGRQMRESSEEGGWGERSMGYRAATIWAEGFATSSAASERSDIVNGRSFFARNPASLAIVVAFLAAVIAVGSVAFRRMKV
jgi:hypothetical protein